MAAETCFRVSGAIASSTATSVRGRPLHGAQHGLLLAKDKVSLPADFIRSPRSLVVLSALSRPSPVRFGRRGRRGSRRFLCQSQNAVDEVLAVVEGNWDNLVANSDKPVLVEFWAPWCGPCRMIAPVIAELAKEYAGKLVCCQVNTDNSPGIATKFGIRSIPTVLVFKDGEKKDSVIGAVPKSALVEIIDKYL